MSDPKCLQLGVDKQLAHLVEEMGEALAAAGKTQRWGLRSYNPEPPDAEREYNWDWLCREMADVQQAWSRLYKTVENGQWSEFNE